MSAFQGPSVLEQIIPNFLGRHNNHVRPTMFNRNIGHIDKPNGLAGSMIDWMNDEQIAHKRWT